MKEAGGGRGAADDVRWWWDVLCEKGKESENSPEERGAALNEGLEKQDCCRKRKQTLRAFGLQSFSAARE